MGCFNFKEVFCMLNLKFVCNNLEFVKIKF